jgi:putative transcriptional regulator
MFQIMVSNRIGEVLKKKEKSWYWLAEQTGAKHNSLWRLKQGRALSISFDLLDRICDVLECEPGEILYRTKDGKPKARKAVAK